MSIEASSTSPAPPRAPLVASSTCASGPGNATSAPATSTDGAPEILALDTGRPTSHGRALAHRMAVTGSGGRCPLRGTAPRRTPRRRALSGRANTPRPCSRGACGPPPPARRARAPSFGHSPLGGITAREKRPTTRARGNHRRDRGARRRTRPSSGDRRVAEGWRSPWRGGGRQGGPRAFAHETAGVDAQKRPRSDGAMKFIATNTDRTDRPHPRAPAVAHRRDAPAAPARRWDDTSGSTSPAGRGGAPARVGGDVCPQRSRWSRSPRGHRGSSSRRNRPHDEAATGAPLHGRPRPTCRTSPYRDRSKMNYHSQHQVVPLCCPYPAWQRRFAR